MKLDHDEERYTEESLELGETVPDFLPSPEELARAERRVKITIALSAESLEYFQQVARQHHIAYQKMIRRLFDAYVRAEKVRTHTRKTMAAD